MAIRLNVLLVALADIASRLYFDRLFALDVGEDVQ